MSDKKVVMAFGRMNPPTAGHALLVNKVHAVAREHGADSSIRLSHSQDSKKNPLSSEQKLKHAKGLFPNANLSASSKESPSYLTHAAELHKKGYKHLVMVAGEDRVKQYHDTLHKYNGKFDEHGNGFHFKSIKVVSAGHRDPDAEGTEGISASKMREHARNNDYKSFHKGLPVGTSHTHGKAIFDDVRKGMKLHEDADRDAYIRGEIFNKGDLVEDLTTGQICPVEFRGDNYVTVLTPTGAIEKRFIKDITMAEKDSVHEDYYLNKWAKEKAAQNRANNEWDRHVAKVKAAGPYGLGLAARVKEKVPTVDHAKMAQHIFHAVGNAFPDGDPYDHMAMKYPHLHEKGTLYKHLNTAVRKHLGEKSWNHMLASQWDDYHADNKNNPDSLTKGQTNPWKESVELEESFEDVFEQAYLEEGLPRSAVKLLQRSDSITKDPDASKPYKVAASLILQGDHRGLKGHLKSAGADIRNHVINSLQQFGGEEGRSFAKHLAMEGIELQEWQVGDIVKPTVGPHAHAPHTIIHKHEDGSYNIKPNLPGKMIKYRLGAVKARPDQLQKYHTEEQDTGPLKVLDEWSRRALSPSRVQIVPKHVYTFNHPKATKDTPVSVVHDLWNQHKVGDHVTVWNAEPGSGKVTYKVTKKDHSGLYGVVHADSRSVKEEAEPIVERRMSDSQKANRERIVKSMKKHLGDFQKRYGKKAKSVMYATATKMAVGEETKYEEPKVQYQVYEVTLDEQQKEVMIPLSAVGEFELCMETVESNDDIKTLVSRLNGIIQQ